MRKINNLEYEFVTELLSKLDIDQHEKFKEFVSRCFAEGFSKSKTNHRSKVFADIILNNPEKDSARLYDRYTTSASQFDRLKIRYGDTTQAVADLKDKYSNRPRPTRGTPTGLTREYWELRGMTPNEVASKFADMQTKRLETRKTNSHNFKSMMPNSVGYWIKRGHSIEEAEQLRRPFVDKSSHTLENFVRRYGPTIGSQKWLAKSSKRSATMIERYGSTVVNGCVSKESLKFFVKLYKALRRTGVARSDIYWGVQGSREFATRDGSNNYFYDFTVKSKKIVVEYNNSFWHPRKGKDFKNPFISFDSALNKDRLKEKLMVERGFQYNVVWEDDDHDAQIKLITEKCIK